jgi:hypothetical protein
LLIDATPSIFEAAATEVIAVRLPTLSHWATPRALHGRDDSKPRNTNINRRPEALSSINIGLKAAQQMSLSPPCWTVTVLRRLPATVGGFMTPTRAPE